MEDRHPRVVVDVGRDVLRHHRRLPLNLLAFSVRHGSVDGNTFALYVIAIAAAEVGVGLAMVLLIYRNRRTIALDDLSEMKG
ncbi:MAG: hypothetical protein EB147_03520 [Acidimicrobiia bacterium]|nr:hypothetical protein [Acidimicrobiia bacterium]